MDAGKFRKMREAALNHEDPLCRLFIGKGVPAHRNKDPQTQRAWGDVILTFTDGTKRSIECTKSDKHLSCSYSLHKPKEYVGIGKPEHAYALLSCLRERGKPEMIHLLVQAMHLHREILDAEESYLSPTRDFYVVSPGDLLDLPGLVAAGDTLEEVTQDFLDQLSKYA